MRLALFCLAAGLAITTVLLADPTTAPATRPAAEPDPMAADWPKMRPITPRGYVCYRAKTPVTIDGNGDDPAWADAPWTDDFVDIEGARRPAPRFRTRAKMLWDDENLYVLAELEEPHVWGTITKRNAVIFYDNDFEIFIDPDGDHLDYHEFEMNALNTIWELSLTKPYRDGGPARDPENVDGLRSAVHVNGTINDPADTDRSWSVEVAIPWKGFARYAGAKAGPPADGDQWRANFSRVEWLVDIIDRKYRKIPKEMRAEDNWVWSPTGVIDMHRPERWGYVQFSTAAAGAATFRPDPTLPARDALMAVYYRQRGFKAQTGRYAKSAAELGPADDGPATRPAGLSPVEIEPTEAGGYTATIRLTPAGGPERVLHVRDDSKLWESPANGGKAAADPAPPVSFTRDIAPVLLRRCQGCHGPDKVKGGYRLDTFAALAKPGESGDPPLLAGKPDRSELYRLIVSTDADDRMPKKGDPLTGPQIALVKRWIEEGAKFDGPDPAASLAMLVGDTLYPDPPEVYPRPVPITALALSPDGKELAAGGYHEVTVWDPASGKLLRRLKGLPQRVHCLAWSPDGSLLAAAGGAPGAGGEVRLLDPAGHKPPRVLVRTSETMFAARFNPDGSRVAVGGADNAIRVFDVASGKQEALIEQHADWVTDVAYSPDGSRLASASRDKSCRVFDAKTGAMEAAYLDHDEPVYGVAWSADGKTLFSGGRDRKLHVWSAKDGSKVAQVGGSDADISRVTTAAGMVFTAGSDGTVRQYTQDKRDLVRTDGPLGDWAYAVAISEKAGLVAAGAFDGEVRVWAIADGRRVAAFVAAPGYVKPKSP